jgi:hypothetical protein
LFGAGIKKFIKFTSVGVGVILGNTSRNVLTKSYISMTAIEAKKDMFQIGRTVIVLLFLGLPMLMGAQPNSWENELKVRMAEMADSLTTHLKPWKVPNRIFKVENYGAKADGVTLNTLAIQKAIDACAAKKGGVVLFSKGDYVTGTIVLKSGVMLEVAQGSRILGSRSLLDYPEKIESFRSIMSHYYEFRQSLIYAEKADRVGIRGKGEIYFRGENSYFPGPQTKVKIVDRPLGIRMVECSNVVVSDILLRNSAAWMQNYLLCNNLIFDAMRVENHANFNNDGLDIDGCRNVIVRNCFINSEDDAMCLKGGSNRLSENILIENSTFISTCNALKIGTDTQGSFRNILARNLKLGGVPDSLTTSSGREASTGVTLATVDGGDVEDIVIANITIEQARCPIFLRIGDRMRVLPELEKPLPGNLQYILIENVNGERNFSQGSFISGVSHKRIENIVIRNLDLKVAGGAQHSFAVQAVVEDEGGYPDAHQFSVDNLPAYGFFVRYAKNVRFENVNIAPVLPDGRPVFMADKDVENAVLNGLPLTQH